VNAKRDYAIGVFDSGLGGLTVVKELMKQLPNEDIVYFGDTARVPYGTKSKESIIRFSIENTQVLLKHKVKMIVVACNSCSSYALSILRKKFDVPIVGVIRPGARRAIESTQNNRIGIIATFATIQSQEYTKTIHEYQKSAAVFSQPCPLFVPLVEEGWNASTVTEDVARQYLAPLKKAYIDTLILGCTHYPLLKSVLKKIMGARVELVDSAREVAYEVRQILESLELTNCAKRKGRHKYLISDRPQQFKKLAKNFLGHDIKNVEGVKDV